MGAVTSFLSPAMINGFTSGSAFHVLTSQIPMSLGITLRKQQRGFQDLLWVRTRGNYLTYFLDSFTKYIRRLVLM